MIRPWQDPLQEWLKKPSNNPGRAPRLAVVGVGNEMNADDAAGVLVIRALHAQADRSAEGERPACLFAIEGGVAPENLTGPLRRVEPDFVLFIDAAEMGEPAGTVSWIPVDQIDGLSASTHTLPLSLYAGYLKLELGCRVGVLGIQPLSVRIGEGVSQPVVEAVRSLAGFLPGLCRATAESG